MTTWAHSPAYGHIVLGPTQEVVYRFVLRATEHGRRPEFSLARIASETGRPVSSVHEALGRLRALGLIGFASRMGRTGGTRLWRATVRMGSVGESVLDLARHRRAVARILKRFAIARTQGHRRTADPPGPSLWPDPSAGVSHPPAEVLSGGTTDATGEPRPTVPPGLFDRMMRKHGFSPWWKDANDGDASESQSATDTGTT